MATRIDPTELRNDRRGRQIAAVIRARPEVIAQAKHTLERWIAQDGGSPDPSLLEWRDALELLDPEDLARFLESTTPRARRMRISSPFVGIDPST